MTNRKLLLNRGPVGAVMVVSAIIVLLFASQPVRAQEQSASQADSKQTAPDQNSVNTREVKTENSAGKNDRLFGVLPNYTTVENKDLFGPLSAKGKFKLAAESSFDPYTFPFIGFIALIGQAENTEPSYGQGFAGYGKRYGTSYGDAIIGTFMTTAVFPSLLRQDPRYYQLGHGSFTHRTLYSVSRIFVTRTDTGHSAFNSSEIGGNAVAAGISNLYHPADDRTVTNTVSVWATDVMWDTVSNVAKEFWPDIRGKISHKKQPDTSTP
jgi:hypothetical protein